MPVYDYACDKAHVEEQSHPMGVYPDVTCGRCNGKMYRVLSAPKSIVFNGPGFYSTEHK